VGHRGAIDFDEDVVGQPGADIDITHPVEPMQVLGFGIGSTCLRAHIDIAHLLPGRAQQGGDFGVGKNPPPIDMRVDRTAACIFEEAPPLKIPRYFAAPHGRNRVDQRCCAVQDGARQNREAAAKCVGRVGLVACKQFVAAVARERHGHAFAREAGEDPCCYHGGVGKRLVPRGCPIRARRVAGRDCPVLVCRAQMRGYAPRFVGFGKSGNVEADAKHVEIARRPCPRYRGNDARRIDAARQKRADPHVGHELALRGTIERFAECFGRRIQVARRIGGAVVVEQGPVGAWARKTVAVVSCVACRRQATHADDRGLRA